MMVFKEMRRKRQLLSDDVSIAILKKMTSGVLSVIDDNGYPYGVPISYVYDEGKIYFHGAINGHKIDAIKHNNNVSFCTIEKDEIIPEKFTTYFRSVIVFGKAKIVTDEAEILKAFSLIADKYSPEEDKNQKDEEILKGAKHGCIIELTIEHISGKESIELVREKSQSSK
jgi:nitroimidazol reductase NimA-like FMN-containing flavoprotein (pyridoxamine 5'-phosphate oxidase superfamily)